MLLLTSLMTASLLASDQTTFVAERAARSDSITVDRHDWPWWRGPNRNGIAAADQQPPLQWSENENVAWAVELPGRGHGSPTVVGEQVVLAAADPDAETQSVLCFDRRTGKQRWRAALHRGGLSAPRLNEKASQASSTVACDGERLFVNFWNGGAVYTTALSSDGKQLWQAKITDYVIHQGYGSSPAVYDSLVIVSADNKGGGVVTALDRATGDFVWRRTRPKLPNYASPIILHTAGRDQLLFIGCKRVTSLDPHSGNQLWEIAGATTECVTSTVTDGELIFTSGGYPRNHVAAVRADGSGEVVWENTSRVYVPSMLVHQGYLYAVQDAGVAVCWDCETGQQMWKGRLGGTFSASPVLVGEHIFATNEEGETFVYEASPGKLELVARNSLGDHVMATPAFCGSRIYLRVAKQINGRRQEMLYCLAATSPR